LITRALHRFLSRARSFHSSKIKFIFLPRPTSWSFLLAFPPKSYMHSFSHHACYMPCQSSANVCNWCTRWITKVILGTFSESSDANNINGGVKTMRSTRCLIRNQPATSKYNMYTLLWDKIRS
jgi:hypothetical protein